MDLQATLAGYRDRVEGLLKQRISSLSVNDLTLHEAMSYGLLNGGKRLRPSLVYLSGEVFGASQSDLDAPATAIELIHSYSLIHDDLPAMDDDDLRRGKPTVHKQFDEATAILVGDALQSLAFDALADHSYQQTTARNQMQMVKTLAKAAGYQGMCGGQAIDLACTNQSVSLEQLQTMHRLKTGALIEASVTLGALAAPDVTPDVLKQLSIYAKATGLAFQVQDDILDITSSTEVLGKPQGSDVRAGKSTYVSLLGLDGARIKASELLEEAQTAIKSLPHNTQLLESFASHIVNRIY